MNHKVKRYDPINSDGTCGMCVEDADYGAYVEYADYAALEAECARLKNSLLAITARHFAEVWKKRTSDAELEQYLSAGIAQLEAERDALAAELSALKAQQAGQELDELRRACAEILGQDPEAWPSHGNAPLAIASALALAVSTAPQPAPAQDVAGWIPVTGRLPEAAQEVIVSTEFEGVCAGILDSYGEWFAPC